MNPNSLSIFHNQDWWSVSKFCCVHSNYIFCKLLVIRVCGINFCVDVGNFYVDAGGINKEVILMNHQEELPSDLLPGSCSQLQSWYREYEPGWPSPFLLQCNSRSCSNSSLHLHQHKLIPMRKIRSRYDTMVMRQNRGEPLFLRFIDILFIINLILFYCIRIWNN